MSEFMKRYAFGRRVAMLSLAAVAVMLCSCKRPDECERYRVLVGHDGFRQQVVAWADVNVFSKQFTSRDQSMIDFRGYGRRSMNTTLRVDASAAGGALSDAVVQIRGDDPSNPDFVFIGSAPFRGLIISRKDFASTWRRFSELSREIEVLDDRVAIECRLPFK